MAPTRVLFFQSQTFFGADSQIHASIMTHLARDEFEVYCAVDLSSESGLSPAARAVSSLADVELRHTNFGPNAETEIGIRNSLRVSLLLLRSLWSLFGLVRFVRQKDIKIIHCTEKPRDAFYGALVARLSGAKQVIHVHVKSELWIRSVVRRAMRQASALIGVSQFVSDSLIETGYDRDRVHTVLNGLELESWPDAAVDLRGLRSSFGIDESTPVLLSASRLFRWKGQHRIIEAMPAVVERFPGVVLLIVGSDDPRGDQTTESYSDELRAMAADRGVGSNVVLTGWRTDIRELMKLADVYVMPSFEEPFGMVYVEAMATRTPVVALDNGGAKEVVDNGGSGLLSDVDDTAALAANMIELLGDPELRARMGAHGRERVVTRFGSRRMAREVEDVYRQLTGRARPVRSEQTGL